jgi:DNA replication protein DnaD
MNDLDNLKIEELHGILIAYEMSTKQDKQENSSRKDAHFKASNKTKIEECKTSDNADNELDE